MAQTFLNQSVADYKFVVLYENFCVRCGEPGHLEDVCDIYKTIICKYWKSKGCTNPNCSYAHGPWDLRKPQKPKCAKVFEIAPRTYVVRGCGDRNTHTYNSGCPRQRLLWPVPQVVPPQTENTEINE
jgi:hypothetical protein